LLFPGRVEEPLALPLLLLRVLLLVNHCFFLFCGKAFKSL
jgi:hypothetical protein